MLVDQGRRLLGRCPHGLALSLLGPVVMTVLDLAVNTSTLTGTERLRSSLS